MIFCQEEDILSQLINGIRYLDIRVGYYPNTDEKWYLNHGLVRIHPLRDVLEDVETFMQQSNEIVILDFHEFPSGENLCYSFLIILNNLSILCNALLTKL